MKAGGGGGTADFFNGTPPPLPLGAFVSLPVFDWYFLSLPEFPDPIDAESAVDVLRRWRGLISNESLEWIVFSRLLPYPGLVELLREVARLASLDTVTDLEGTRASLGLSPGGGHSEKAS
jgi:hypothetical protein